MPTIFFGGSSGKSFAKKRRRMPGTNKSFKPEMKYYDGFNTASGADVFVDRTWVNLLSSTQTLPTNVSYSWRPYVISPPQMGTGVNQRVGKNYLLRYIKIKGCLSALANVQSPINWRLCLCRIENPSPGLPSASGYLEYFTHVDSTSNTTTAAGAEYWSYYNYYFKMKRSDVSNEFRRKVIASGSLPATYTTFSKYNQARTFQSPASASDLRTINSSVDSIYSGIGNTDHRTRFPIDVSVTLNDNIDTDTMRYFIVLETDTGYGIDTTVQTGSADGDKKVMDYDYRQFDLQIFCKCYFEDY